MSRSSHRSTLPLDAVREGSRARQSPAILPRRADRATGPRTTVDDLLAAARRGLVRLGPAGAHAAQAAGARLIDIRPESQIALDGAIPGALVLPRNAVEWRLDPTCPYRHRDAPGLDEHVVVVCDEGYQSSLVAATLQQLGFARATDLDGGFQAWRAAGLPVAAADDRD